MKNAKQEFYNQQKQSKKEDEIKDIFRENKREFITGIFTLKKTQKMFLSPKENKPTGKHRKSEK